MRAEFLALGVGTHPMALLAQGGEALFLEVFARGLETVAKAFTRARSRTGCSI